MADSVELTFTNDVFGSDGGGSATYSGDIVVDYTDGTFSGTASVTDPAGTNSFSLSGTLINDGDGTYQLSHGGLSTGYQFTLGWTGETPSTGSANYTDYNHGYSYANGEYGGPPAQPITSTTACYCSGTLIRTARGDLPVEDLRIGDVVMTASGALRPIKWIGHRGYSGRFANGNPDVLPICFKAGSLGESVPARDLWVSPKHAMFLDGALFPAEMLVNGASVIKAESIESVTYWHVELDSHDVLIAEGAASESFVDDESRGMFHNARTFAAMYPDEAVPVSAVYCAPRVEDGHQLEAVRRAIAVRAGIAAVPDCGVLQGYIDSLDATEVRGWVRSALNPAMPVCLDLVVDGHVVSQVLANRPRADLEAAGYGAHAFAIPLPTDAAGKSIEVRRSADGARLKAVLDRAA